jgi:hypothetical protein
MGKTMKHMIELLANSAEFDTVPIRQGEESLLRALEYHLTYPIEAAEGDQD